MAYESNSIFWIEVEKVVPNPHEILYWVNKDDPTGPAPLNPYNDSQFLLWEIPAERWVASNGLPNNAWNAIPTTYDDLHGPELKPQINIINPTASTTYDREQKMIIQTTVTSSFTINRVDFSMNGVFLGSSHQAPYEFAFIPSQTSGISDTNQLHITAYDTVGNTNDTSVVFSLTTNTLIN